MPIHNGEQYLSETLSSICAQSHEDWHLVAILDSCTDSSEVILRAAIPNHLLSVVTVDNRNVAKNLNIGMMHCDSEIIFRIDCDDLMHPDRIKKQIEYLESHSEISAVTSNVRYIGEDSEPLGESNFCSRETDVSRKMLMQNIFSHPSAAIRKSALQKCGGYSEFIVGAEDYDLWLRMISQGFNLAIIQDSLTAYRIHRKQESNKKLPWKSVRQIFISRWQAAKFSRRPIRGIVGNARMLLVNVPFLVRPLSISSSLVLLFRQQVKILIKRVKIDI